MDIKLIHQPEHHFRLFDLFEKPKTCISSIHDYEQVALVTLEEAVEPLVAFVSSVKDMVKLVKEKCLQLNDNLSIDESASLMLYTSEWLPKEESFYYIFNRILDTNDHNQLKSCYCYLKLLSVVIVKLPIASTRIFYRGIKSDLKTEYPSGTIFSWYGFSSCTSSIDILDRDDICFGRTGIRTLFIIHSEEGKTVSKHSFYKIPNEILLPPGQEFQVISNRTSKDGLCIIVLKEFSPSNLVPSTCKIKNEQFELLFQKRIEKFEKYSEISLQNQNIMDHHVECIVQHAIHAKQCIWLSLVNNQITSNGLSILANGLKTNTSLEALYLSQNLLTDTGVGELTKILTHKYSYLTFLDLNYNRIKDEGARYLATMLKTNRILTDLWLSYNEISDDGAQALANILTFDNTTLMQLYLNGNLLISDAITDSFVNMLTYNETLNTLRLQNCNLTIESNRILEKAVEARENFDLYV